MLVLVPVFFFPVRLSTRSGSVGERLEVDGWVQMQVVGGKGGRRGRVMGRQGGQ